MIALTDGSVVSGVTWSSRRPGPVGHEYVAQAESYSEVPLADGAEHYEIVDRGYSGTVEDVYGIATAGYSGPSQRD